MYRRLWLKKFETTKLFWGKYLYKLSICNSLAPIFRAKNLSYAREVLDGLQFHHEKGLPLFRTSWKKQTPVSEQDFLDAKNFYSKFKNFDDYLLRIENVTMNIYSNDKEWLKELVLINPHIIDGFWEPDDNYRDQLTENTIIVNESNGYEYKVTLGSRLGNTGFFNFAKTNPHLVKVGPVLFQELERSGYVNNLYFYARDYKVIQLCNLLLGNIRRIDKLVVKSNIDK